MSNLVIPAPKQITIPIHESDQEFPVRRIYCIGRNYAAHTIEMGFDPDKEPPFFFQKNTFLIFLVLPSASHGRAWGLSSL